jgi:uncharacterized protein involved in oxidation of intracellular sulfur
MEIVTREEPLRATFQSVQNLVVLRRSKFSHQKRKGDLAIKMLFILTIDDGETIYNAMRLANVGVEKGDEVSVFMVGKGVLFEKSGSEQIDVMGQMDKFEGDFYF